MHKSRSPPLSVAYVSEKVPIRPRHAVVRDCRRGGPSNADKALRSPTQLAMARGTTKPDSTKHVVVSVQVRKSGDIWPFCVQAQAAEDVLEWLQPSGRRPEGCCCSTELSGGRGRLPEATGYRHLRTMHVPCMPTLTLADSLTDMNPSTTRTATLLDVARHRPRCTAAARRSESSAAATEKAATAHHRGRPRCSDKHSGHSGAMPAATIGQSRRPVLLVLDDPSARAEGTVVLNVIVTHARSRNTCNVKSMLCFRST